MYGTPHGLTSLWYSLSPCIACLLLPHLFTFSLSKILFWLCPQLPGSDLFSSTVPWFSKATEFSLIFCLPAFFLSFWEAVWETWLLHNHLLMWICVTAMCLGSSKDLFEGRIVCEWKCLWIWQGELLESALAGWWGQGEISVLTAI